MSKPISILLPSRNRSEQLLYCLDTLMQKTKTYESLEFLIHLNLDDSPSVDAILARLLGNYGPDKLQSEEPVILIDTMVGYDKFHHYYNRLGRLATGDWLFHYSDDAFMETDGWDAIFLEEVARLGLDGTRDIVCFQPKCNGEPNCFPIISRKWFELTGHFSQHISLYGWIERVASALGVMHDSEVAIFHAKHEYTGDPKDQTRLERDDFLKDWKMNPDNSVECPYQKAKWEKDIELLYEYIQGLSYASKIT